MNLNSPWDLFVQKTLRDLHNGAQIPEYFGCLIPILTSGNLPVNFINQTNYNQIDADDDFISIDVVKPKVNSQKSKQGNNFDFMNPSQQKQQQQKEQREQYTNSNENVNVNNEYDDQNQPHSSFSPQSWANPNDKSSPPQLRNLNNFGSNSYESPSMSTSAAQKNIESSSQLPSPSPPPHRGIQRKIQNNQFQDQNHEEEQEPEPAQEQGQNDFDEFEEFDDDDYSHYAAKFREIGVNVFDKYWYPMNTIVPRMTPESKLMATFKTSKFNRLKKLMTEAKKQTNNKLKFSRIHSSK